VNEVVLSGLAESDLADIWAFVAQDDHVAAERLIEEVLGKFRMLAVSQRRPETPRIGCVKSAAWRLGAM